MRALLLSTFLLTASIANAQAAPNCDFGGDTNFEHTVKLLESAPSCKQANTILHACMWGSSADTAFAPIAVAKCEKVFLKKLPQPAEERYIEEMQLCPYGESRQDGTMPMSAAAICQANVAEDFADHPDKWKSKPLRASFDCSLAKTPLETTICSNISLGHADIVLSRNYNGFLKNADPSQRPALIASERAWLNSLPAKCNLSTAPASPKTINCLRNEFELRFTLLDACGGPMEDCVNGVLHPDPRDANTSEASDAPRASFDCEKPTSPLELTVCAYANLGEADNKLAALIEDAKRIIPPRQQKALDGSQNNWLKFVNSTCPWGAIGGVPSIYARGCVEMLYEKRIAQVQRCARQPVVDQAACFSRLEGISKTTH
ncbi:MAG TPA: lysozyme inhibitor LprI family protein [Acidobacteriaceae bacterium]|nr:lysozyme inhibitor LprI family protein [Acidobacteriaceae bacterium]